MLASVRKEVRGVGVCAPAHIVDRLLGNAGVAKLKSNQRSKIPVGCSAATSNHRMTTRSTLHLARNLFANFKRAHAYVWTDRRDQLGRVMTQRLDGSGHDTGHRAPPTRVHCCNVPARRMRDQHRHAVGRARGDPKAFRAGDERVPFRIRRGFNNSRLGYLPHLGPVHLPLFKQAIAAKPEALCKARAILLHRVVIITEMKAEIERVVRRGAHSAETRCECMAKSVPVQKGGMHHGHIVLFSMAKAPMYACRQSWYQTSS